LTEPLTETAYLETFGNKLLLIKEVS
jgi:hypothetical protein